MGQLTAQACLPKAGGSGWIPCRQFLALRACATMHAFTAQLHTLPPAPPPPLLQDYSQTESTMHNKMQQVAGQPAYRGAHSSLYAATEPSLEGGWGCAV